MHGAVAFDEVLDQTLKSFIVEPPVGHAAGPSGTGVSYGFFFLPGSEPTPVHASGSGVVELVELTAGHVSLAPGARTTVQGVRDCTGVLGGRGRSAAARPIEAERASAPGPAGVRSAQPSRRLSVLQRFALAELIGLGASLDERFTAEQLRSAFRTLAHRYHPDRHADRGEAEQAELAVMFRRLHDAYTRLAHA